MRFGPFLLVVSALALTGCGERNRSPEASGSLPSPDERLRAWEALPEGTSVPVALGFAAPLPDSAIAALLTRHGVRPYAVYLRTAGMDVAQQREKSRASLELVGEAREQAAAQLRTALCAQAGRARALAQAGEPDLAAGRELLAYIGELQGGIRDLEAGAPAIYGVEVVGAVDDVRALREDADVASWEPGWLGGGEGADSVTMQAPPAPRGTEAAADSSARVLDGEAVRAQLVDLAENGLGSCESMTPSDEPR